MEKMTVGQFKAHFSDALKKVQLAKRLGFLMEKEKKLWPG